MAQGKSELKFESNPCSNFRDNRCHRLTTGGWTTDGRRTTDEFRFHELCWQRQAELKIVSFCGVHQGAFAGRHECGRSLLHLFHTCRPGEGTHTCHWPAGHISVHKFGHGQHFLPRHLLGKFVKYIHKYIYWVVIEVNHLSVMTDIKRTATGTLPSCNFLFQPHIGRVAGGSGFFIHLRHFCLKKSVISLNSFFFSFTIWLDCKLHLRRTNFFWSQLKPGITSWMPSFTVIGSLGIFACRECFLKAFGKSLKWIMAQQTRGHSDCWNTHKTCKLQHRLIYCSKYLRDQS